MNLNPAVGGRCKSDLDRSSLRVLAKLSVRSRGCPNPEGEFHGCSEMSLRTAEIGPFDRLCLLLTAFPWMNRSFDLSLVCALLIGLAAWHGVVAGKAIAATEGPSIVKGRVSDVDGRAVEGARIFVYDSTDVRRSANFISAGSDREGLYRMVLPPGRYWVVVRVKKTEDYGPLMPGDKHSGEPAELEVGFRGEVAMDFIVADLKEAIKAKAKTRERFAKIGGRIIDRDGAPVKGAYAIAHSNEKVIGIPDYLSAWVDDEGHYTLYLPKGDYYLGAALAFPTDNNYFMQGEITVDGDRIDVTITRKSTDNK